MTVQVPPRAPQRVVIINDSAVATGGATSLALLSARRLAARGLAVTYLSGDAGDPALAGPNLVTEALGQRPIASAGRARVAARGLHNAAAAALVARHVARDDGATVYHVHGWSKILSPAIFAPLADVAERVVVHAHDYFLACPNGAYMDYRAERVCTRTPLGAACLATHCDKRSYPQKLWRCGRQANLRRTLPGVLRGGARVVAIHEGMGAGLVRGGVPESSLRTVRNPATRWCARRVRAEDNRTLFFVGQVTAEKGVDLALDAAAALGSDIEVIGDGERRDALQRRHPDVRFHGRLPSSGIADEIGRARALVVPSRYPEPFGLVIAEAVSSGVPVVLPSSALLASDVAAHGLGIVYEPNVSGALRAALHEISTLDTIALRAMSRRAHDGAARLALGEEEWIDALLRVYAECPAPRTVPFAEPVQAR